MIPPRKKLYTDYIPEEAFFKPSIVKSIWQLKEEKETAAAGIHPKRQFVIKSCQISNQKYVGDAYTVIAVGASRALIYPVYIDAEG